MTTIVKVKLGVPGFHAWPGAPTEREYLRARHRHMFGFVIEVRVGDGDREVEFHDLKDEVRLCLIDGWIHGASWVEFGQMSCEDIATKMFGLLAVSYRMTSLAVHAVEVWEDGECGARVEV